MTFIVCLAALKLRHKLSKVCIVDILTLISMICIIPHNCPTTYYKFEHYFVDFQTQLKKHFYCTKCQTFLSNTDDDVDNDEFFDFEEVMNVDEYCDCEDSEKSYFLEISPISQLESLYCRPDFYNSLQNRSFSEVNEYQDIYDGEKYKQLSSENGILSSKQNISFQWYTDGVRIFKSSKYSIWGFFLIILELPYAIRYKVENILLIALWFGEKKPNPNLFLSPLTESLKKIYKGIRVYAQDLQNWLTIRGITISGTCDLPAKALFLCMNQYNGKFGCQVCKEPGQQEDRTHVYPYRGNLRLRTDAETIHEAKLALEVNKPVCGVKGPTILSKLCYDHLTSTSIDVMHCAFEGCVKRLGELWFDEKYNNENFSIHNLVDVVDYRLCSIKPPYSVARRPRPIKTHFSYWKASEYKNWGLYYALPVLRNLLPDEYLEHYMYFLLAIYYLSQPKVTDEMIQLADLSLKEFVKKYQDLYGLKYMTCNVHSLLHLPEMVRRFGPLWTTSCFPLEDLNGKIKAMVHGSKSPHLQIINNLSIYMAVYTYKNQFLGDNQVAFEWCKRILSPAKQLKLRKIGNSIYIAGSLSKKIPINLRQIIKDNNLHKKNIVTFHKLYKDNILFTSEQKNNKNKYESFYVKYSDFDQVILGSIQIFLRITNCNCKKLCACSGNYFAIIKQLQTENPFSVNLHNGLLPFIYKCSSDRNILRIIDVKYLKLVCYHVKIEIESSEYLIEPVNTVESE